MSARELGLMSFGARGRGRHHKVTNPLSMLHISDLHRSPEDPISNEELVSARLHDRDRYVNETPPIRNRMRTENEIADRVEEAARLCDHADELETRLGTSTDAEVWRFVEGGPLRHAAATRGSW